MHAATLAGARALGIERTTGSIEPGKAADLVAVDLRATELEPCYDVVSQLVYSAGREHVSHVWVSGRMLVREGQLEAPAPALASLNPRLELWQNALGKTAGRDKSSV